MWIKFISNKFRNLPLLHDSNINAFRDLLSELRRLRVWDIFRSSTQSCLFILRPVAVIIETQKTPLLSATIITMTYLFTIRTLNTNTTEPHITRQIIRAFANFLRRHAFCSVESVESVLCFCLCSCECEKYIFF